MDYSFLEYTIHVKSALQEQIDNMFKNTNVLKPYHKVYLERKCVCCMSEFEDIAVVLPCGHLFHETCIIEWSKQHKTYNTPCPKCRGSFIAKS